MQTLSETITIRGWGNACFHAVFLIIMTTTVAIFYDRQHPADVSLVGMALWSITPYPCHRQQEDVGPACIPSSINALNNASDCILNTNHKYYFYTSSYEDRSSPSLCNLIGESPMFEREGTNLFSVLGIPFILLASQVITTVFALMYVRNDSLNNTHSTSTNVQKSLKRIALLMLIVYATSFLLIQNSWKIPGNNLFLVIIFLLFVAFLFSFLPSSHFSELAKHKIMPLRLGEYVLTIPLLTAASLGVAGNTIITDVTNAFFCVLFTNAFLLLAEAYKKNEDSSSSEENAVVQRTFLLNAWLCLIPFIMYCSVTIERMSYHHHYPWALACIVTLLIYEILYVAAVTVYNLIDRPTQYTSLLSTHTDHFNQFNLILDFLSVSAQIIICMSVIGGAVATFAATAKH